MLINKIVSRIIYIIVLVFVCWAFLKYVEWKSIFFPMKSVELTPGYMGLFYEDINFKTSDGLELNGWFIPAKESRVTLLFCHGNAGNIGHRVESIDIFNGIGFNTFIFDYRGYGKSHGFPSEKGIYLDALAAYDYLTKQRGIDENSIVIYGKSLGGAAAIDLARKVEHRALIVESAFSSMTDMAREVYPFLPVRIMISAKYNSISKIPYVGTPKLIIHSQDDEIVPYKLGEKLFKAAGEPKEFYKMRGGHNEAFLFAKEEFKSAIRAFLKRYNIL